MACGAPGPTSVDFNPRSPRGERRFKRTNDADGNGNFNPRSPRGERLPLFPALFHLKRNFNPRSPRGERLVLTIMGFTPDSKFQSTLPAGGATVPSCYFLHFFLAISIHAPRGGSDLGTVRRIPSLPCDFNPRSPRGERRKVSLVCYNQPTISIHAPRGGSDDDNKAYLQERLEDISIHAPRGGSDHLERLVRTVAVADFNPRSPRGERLCFGYKMAAVRLYFNPRSPRGERRPPFGIGLALWRHFNPRSPRGERHSFALTFASSRKISIHAPRGGSDSKSACFLCENLSIYHKFCTQIFLKAFPPLLST